LTPRIFKIVVAGLQLLLKESRKNILTENIPIPSLYRKRSWEIVDFIFGFRDVTDPAETDLRIDFIGEYDAKCETTLGLNQSPRWS
jgi:hypothetical protein